MRIVQSEITGTQTKFSTIFVGKVSFIPSFLFPEHPPMLFHSMYVEANLVSASIVGLPLSILYYETDQPNQKHQHDVQLLFPFDERLYHPHSTAHHLPFPIMSVQLLHSKLTPSPEEEKTWGKKTKKIPTLLFALFFFFC
jgi:hypothetical protein